MPPTESERWSRSGLLFAVGAYAIWGVMPIYMLLLLPAGALEIVGFRIVLSLAMCLVLLAVTRAWRRFGALLRDRRAVLLLAVASLLVSANWLLYAHAIISGAIVEAALGYFINPLMTVLIGVLLLRERLRPAQWAALGIALIAIVVVSIGYGSVPVLSIAIAATFAVYGYFKRILGPRVDAIGGLTVETAWLTPAAVALLVVLGSTTGLGVGQGGAVQVVAMLFAGVATATPLLLFAAATRRVPLVAVGLTQFLAPLLQFMFGVFVMGEDMPIGRWIGFGLVWVAVIILMVDLVASSRRSRALIEPPGLG